VAADQRCPRSLGRPDEANPVAALCDDVRPPLAREQPLRADHAERLASGKLAPELAPDSKGQAVSSADVDLNLRRQVLEK